MRSVIKHSAASKMVLMSSLGQGQGELLRHLVLKAFVIGFDGRVICARSGIDLRQG